MPFMYANFKEWVHQVKSTFQLFAIFPSLAKNKALPNIYLTVSDMVLLEPVAFNRIILRRNGRQFAGDIFKCIFVNENVSIAIKISLKCVCKGRINNIAALVQIMAWHRAGDEPLSEPMMVSLPTDICVTRPQWVNTSRFKYNFICLKTYNYRCKTMFFMRSCSPGSGKKTACIMVFDDPFFSDPAKHS